MKNWKDEHGIVHMVDGLDCPWCGQTRGMYPTIVPNTSEVETCITCVALRTRFLGGAEDCDECGASIPNEEHGSLVNRHHQEACSLYDHDGYAS